MNMRVYIVTETFRMGDYDTNILGVFNADTTSENEIREFIYNYIKDDCYGGEEPNENYFYDGTYDNGNVVVDYTVEDVQ